MGDRGAVTAELAVALPAVLLVLAVLLVTASAGAAQLRCGEAARVGARIAALGESDAEVVAAAQRVAGAGARVSIGREPPWVEVQVRAAGPGGWFTAGPVDVSARAVAWVEP